MQTKILKTIIGSLSLLSAAIVITGCASTEPNGTTAQKFPTRYRSTDGRDVEIGARSASDNGWAFRDPHIDKIWITDNFNFSGYDVVYIAPTLSTAKFHDDEARPHELAKENLVLELQREFETKGIFPKVVTTESAIPQGARVLKLQNTILEYAKGGGAARYWAGLYGAGQPTLRVQGKLTDADKAVFTYEARRSGVSFNARMGGAFMKDEDIQLEDIRSMSLDLADFMAAINGKYTPKN